MAFTVEDFEDLYRLLSEHPDWRARLRPLILGDEFIQVPERLNRIDERLDRISETLVEFDERMNRIATLLEVLTGRMGRVETRLGAVDGRLLELKYGDNLGNWFPGHVLHPERLFVDDLERLLEAEERGIVSEEDLDSIAAVDLIVRGVQRGDSGAELVLLAEVSTTINRDDVERAVQPPRSFGEQGTTRSALSAAIARVPTHVGSQVNSRSSSICKGKQASRLTP
jgi:hypothetical protein